MGEWSFLRQRAPKEWLLATKVNWNVTLTGFYLGFTVWGRSPDWPKAKSFLGGCGGMSPPEMFWNEYTLRCNLVHFKAQLWEVLQCALTSSRLDNFSDIVTKIL